MKYYIAQNGQQAGPFEENDLIANGVTVNTLVWCEGMAQWTKAGQVDALSHIFATSTATPPTLPPHPKPKPEPQQQQYTPQPPVAPLPNYGYGQPNRPMMPPPSNHLALAILVTIFCCLPFGIIGIVKANKVDSLYRSGFYAEALQASSEAQSWSIWGIVLGILICCGLSALNLLPALFLI